MAHYYNTAGYIGELPERPLEPPDCWEPEAEPDEDHEEEDDEMDKTKRHAEICQGLTAMYERKNHDYGDSFHQTFVEEGMAMARIRLSDKLNRFKTLTRNAGQKVQDESVRDTLLDLANYAIMTVMEMEEQDG